MTKVLFLVPSLGGGGAETHAIRLANALPRERFEVLMVSVRRGGEFAAVLDTSIERCELFEEMPHSRILRGFSGTTALRRLVRSFVPDVIYSVLSSQNILAAITGVTLGCRPRIVMSVQNVPNMAYAQSSRLRWMDRLSLVRADAIIVPTEGIANELRQMIPSIAERLCVIPNVGISIERSDQIAASGGTNKTLNIVSAGRFVAQKNFDLLLEAFALVTKDRDAKLTVYGDGPLRADLMNKASALGIEKKITLPGVNTNLAAAFREADLFVLTSRFEGFGNVLVEAMAVGVPVIATDCPYGPKEILGNGACGVLVPEDAGLIAKEILRLAVSPERRRALVDAGRLRALDFAPERIAPVFADLFEGINH